MRGKTELREGCKREGKGITYLKGRYETEDCTKGRDRKKNK